jgi:aerobic carbon-monoxide dehydrogenase medium subunit
MTLLAVHRSRKLIPDFSLLRPRSAEEACAMQARAPEASLFMAGGIDVINRLKFGAPVAALVHLGAVPGLDEITETPDGLTIGAAVTHDALQRSALVRARLPALAAIWSEVGNIRIRLKGTLGGNVMAREPAYDVMPALMAAGALLRFLGADGAIRRIEAASLTDAVGRPVPQTGLLTAIELPARGLALGFDRSLRPMLSLAVGLDGEAGKLTGGRIGSGCAFAAPLGATLPLGGMASLDELARAAGDVARAVAAGLPEPASDLHAGGAYRRRMVEVLLRRRLEVMAAPAA